MQKLARAAGVGALVLTGVAVDRAAQSFSAVPPASHAAGAISAPVASDQAVIAAFDKASRAVVQVVSVGVGSGSGVVYDAAGDIVTNNHVVAGARRLQVKLVDGRTLPARLIGTDPRDDIAVIRVSGKNLPVATFGDSRSLRIAQRVLAIGNPLGLQQTVTDGLVSATGRTVQESASAYLPDVIQTSAPINPGNSGGALVALDGSVVGIPTLVAANPEYGTQAQGIGYAISSARVKEIVPQIIKYGKVQHTGRAYLGVALGSPNQSSSPFGQPTAPASGAQLADVTANGPAGKAGLQQGDVIVALNGAAVSSADDLLAALAQHRPGQTVTLKAQRDGQTLIVKVKLGELPAN